MPTSRPPYPTAVLLLAAGALLACAPQAATPDPAPAAAPAGARGVVARMHAQHAGRWYETLEFRQRNTAYTAAGEARDAGEWLERQRVPKLLRIDFVAPQANGSGILFRSDTQYVFDAGTLDQSMPLLHPLLLLSADAYALPVDSTVRQLARLGIDTTRVRRGTWQARPVHVVGAAAGDSTTPQFWIDAERLLLVRLVHAQRAANGRTVATDYHLTYQDVAGVPVPREIVFHRDGRPYFRETYLDVRPNAAVADSLFDPAHWARGIPAR
jgi:hypothetical protein